MNYRIGDGTKWLMLGLVSTIDIVEFFLTILQIEVALETVADIIEYGILWGWFKMYGIDYFATKRASRQIFTGVIEAVPYLGGLLPLLTWTVWKTIKESREEDENQNPNQNPNILRQRVSSSSSQKPTGTIRIKKS
jgi:hypothetical protein